MDLLQQITLLLSEPPGSLIYHLITLFSLQAVFAISFSLWRREPDDEQALHMVWASGAIFIARLIFLLIGLFWGSSDGNQTSFLPPLEYALNTASAALIVWSLLPSPKRFPHAIDILLVITLLLTMVMALFFFQEWLGLVAAGESNYGQTTQGILWSVIQIVILTGGLVFLLISPQTRTNLPPIIVAVLLLTHVIQLWNTPEYLPTDTNIPFWIRLGYLIALPVWAIFAYQKTLTPLLSTNYQHKTFVSRFGDTLIGSGDLIANPQRQSRIVKSLSLTTALMDARFSAIGLLEELNRELIHFQSDLDQSNSGTTKKWTFNLADHSTLKTALTQNQIVELSPTGVGAKQLNQFYQEVQVEGGGAILVQPLNANGANHGLLIVSGHEEIDQWPEENRLLFAGLARFIAQALFNSQTPKIEAPKLSTAEPRSLYDSLPAPILLDQVRLHRLESEVKELRKALGEMEQGKKRAEEKAQAAQKQARYLAAALRAAQQNSEGSVQGSEPRSENKVTPQQDTIQSPNIEEIEN